MQSVTDSNVGSEKLHAGTINGAYGVKGWVRVHALTDPLENFLAFPAWFVEGAGRHGKRCFEPLRFEAGRRHGKGLIVKIEGVDDRTAAEQLRGTQVWVDAQDLAPLDDDDYYWHQLEGLEVWSWPPHRSAGSERGGVGTVVGDGADGADGAEDTRTAERVADAEFAEDAGDKRTGHPAPMLLGVVDHLLGTGANDVLVTSPCEGSIDQRERLIPYLPGDVVRRVDTQVGRIDVRWHPDD